MSKSGNYLLTFRKQNKLTRKQVSETVNVSLKYVQLIENGKRLPSLNLLIRFNDSLNCPISETVQLLIEDLRSS